jgi:hypothetical protein
MTTLDPREPRVPLPLLIALVIVAVLGVAIGLGVQEWRWRGFTAVTQSQLERAKEAIREDNQFAISVFTKLADKNNPDAQYWLGYMTELGLGTPVIRGGLLSSTRRPPLRTSLLQARGNLPLRQSRTA